MSARDFKESKKERFEEARQQLQRAMAQGVADVVFDAAGVCTHVHARIYTHAYTHVYTHVLHTCLLPSALFFFPVQKRVCCGRPVVLFPEVPRGRILASMAPSRSGAERQKKNRDGYFEDPLKGVFAEKKRIVCLDFGDSELG